MIRWRIKVKSNDELRQQFLRQFVPLIQEYSLQIPDEGLRWDEASGQYVYTEPDWDEFRRILRGEGPKTRQRLDLRNRFHAQHRWVREAIARWSQVA
jgi:ring-1,2-phenylacetyl-CoA epoxidase subunit PaaA